MGQCLNKPYVTPTTSSTFVATTDNSIHQLVCFVAPTTQ